MARFFIDRPVFAWVIAIIIMLAGGISILNLPISQYPSIAPPTIGITAQYPGASAQTVQDTVTQVIEQNMNGLDYLLYMSSTSDSSGQAQITLTFSADANPDIAQVQVQNKLQLATPPLPAGSAAAGHFRGQARRELPEGVRLRVRRRQHGQRRHRGLCGDQPQGCDQPYLRRRRSIAVRQPVRHAPASGSIRTSCKATS